MTPEKDLEILTGVQMKHNETCKDLLPAGAGSPSGDRVQLSCSESPCLWGESPYLPLLLRWQKEEL